MSATLPLAYRILAATALHKGDRPYQQDQVEILRHGRHKDCLLAVLADGMGGKSGGRKAADQVVLTARQIFDRYVPSKDDAVDTLRQLVRESPACTMSHSREGLTRNEATVLCGSSSDVIAVSLIIRCASSTSCLSASAGSSRFGA